MTYDKRGNYEYRVALDDWGYYRIQRRKTGCLVTQDWITFGAVYRDEHSAIRVLNKIVCSTVPLTDED
jgi:hypothetical protein